jgi:hypothetical protein
MLLELQETALGEIFWALPEPSKVFLKNDDTYNMKFNAKRIVLVILATFIFKLIIADPMRSDNVSNDRRPASDGMYFSEQNN